MVTEFYDAGGALIQPHLGRALKTARVSGTHVLCGSNYQSELAPLDKGH